MEFQLGHIRSELMGMASTPEIIRFGEKGMIAMAQLLSIHKMMMQAVTRMDSTGVIIHTVPVVESAIGADISSQEHVAAILETHEEVLSDVFQTVQGYSAIALHVPVLDDDGVFVGTLAALIPYRKMIEGSFQQLQTDEHLSAWIISQDNRILYSDFDEDAGRLVTELEEEHPGFNEIVCAASSGGKGFMITDFDPGHDPGGVLVEMLSSFYPVKFGNVTWTIILSAPRSDVLTGITGFGSSWLVGAIIFILAVLAYLTLKIRSMVSSKDRLKWDTVARDRDLLAASVEQAKEAILITDSEGLVTYVNPAVESITAVSADEFPGSTIETHFDDVTAEKFLEIASSVWEHGEWSGVVDAVSSTGRRFILDMTVSPVKDRTGEVSNYVVVGRDVTVQSEMKSRLRERQKMEAIGQLAGGIAHDFNNLVTAIMGYADLLTRNYPPESGAGKAGEVIKSAAYRASDLTDQLLGFARKGKQQIERVDLSKSVKNVSQLLGRILDMRISVELDLEDDVVIMGDPVQIEQVILNLAVNSKDAMPDGGTLSYEVTRSILTPDQMGQRTGFQSGAYAILRVRDTGTGIPAEIQERIFEPFFTTKEEGYGSGMGLATVYGIVANHGGWIDLESMPGSGTIFTICIPIAPDSNPADIKAAKTENPVSGGSSVILVVDDELVVLNTVEEMLRNLGYTVLTAPGGEIAVKIYREQGDSIDLVIMDLAMPGMDGTECFRRLRELDDSVNVILSSGYGREGRAQELLDDGVLAFLRKPYSLSDLSGLLREILG